MNGGRNASEKRRSRDFGRKKGRSGCEPSVAVKRNKHKDRGNGTRNNKKKKRRRKTQRWRENPTHVFDAAAAASLPAAGRAARSRRMLCIRAGRAGRAGRARLGLRGGRQRPRAPGRRPSTDMASILLAQKNALSGVREDQKNYTNAPKTNGDDFSSPAEIETYQDTVLDVNIENWYELIKDHTMKTAFVPIPFQAHQLFIDSYEACKFHLVLDHHPRIQASMFVAAATDWTR